jgi:hypothetical protein
MGQRNPEKMRLTEKRLTAFISYWKRQAKQYTLDAQNEEPGSDRTLCLVWAGEANGQAKAFELILSLKRDESAKKLTYKDV